MEKTDKNFWRTRLGIGAKKSIPSPEILLELAAGYFQTTSSTVDWKQQDFIRGGDNAGQVVYLDQTTPFTWEGLEQYIRSEGYKVNLDHVRSNTEGMYAEFKDVVRIVDRAIYKQKFEGATVGAFNPLIIIRDLGLVEKQSLDIAVEQPLFPDETEE